MPAPERQPHALGMLDKETRPMSLLPARLTGRHRLAVLAPLTALAVALALVAMTSAVQAGQPKGYGPSAPFDDALMGDDGPVEPMKNMAKIVRTKHGYRLTAGQQHSRLTVKAGHGKLRFHDAGTRRWKSLPRSCKAKRARGVAAVCAVPSWASKRRPALLEIHPRLGNDHVDGSTLPRKFEMAVLADAGYDVVRTGAGKDFVNGAHQRDRISTGAGRDWIRGGRGADRLRGGPHSDYIVGQDGRDNIRGGGGKDRVYR